MSKKAKYKSKKKSKGRKGKASKGRSLPDDEIEVKEETQGVPDLDMLINLDMKHVLDTIHHRWRKMTRKNCYTSVSTILLATNPYERLPIYGQDVINEFHDAAKKGRLPKESGKDRPHPYGVASRSYMRMTQRKCNQSVIVCGESGSGKGETAKLLIRYLVMTAPSVDMESSIVEQQIIAASPILEAYGNAKTVLNNNSSRFAKFTKILYDVPDKAKSGYILGSYSETYLLEKSRVVFQNQNERNYHIPYFLYHGIPKDQHDQLGIIHPQNWQYTSQGNCVEVPGISDINRYEELKESLQLMRVDENIQTDLWSITSGIFNLGNIGFKREDDGFVSVDDGDTFVETVSQLWGIDAKTLTARLTTASMKVMKKLIIKKLQYKSAAESSPSMESRDAIAKGLFENTFLYLMERINAEIYQTDEDNVQNILFIGILDIFGFQNFWNNSFEQFCMNFVNEKIQQFFNYHIIRSEQEEYIKESVLWTPISVPDNLDYINFVENKDVGFFSLLDSACKAPKPMVEAFMQDLFKRHGTNRCIKRATKPGGGNARGGPRNRKNKKNKDRFDGFEIIHFADTVTYNASQFLMKNMENIHPDTAKMCKKSTLVLMKEIGGGAYSKGRKKKSVSSIYHTGIKTLMKNLSATEPFFVFCVNPNMQKSSTIWSNDVVERQLRSGGLVQALKVLKLGYPTRVPYYTLYDQYHSHVTNPLIKNMGPEAFSTALLIAFDVNEEDYELGLTKIFFKPSKAAVLDTIMAQAGQPLSAGQIRKITKWVVSKRVTQLIGICKAFLNYKKMIKAMRSSSQMVVILENTIDMCNIAYTAKQSHKRKVSIYGAVKDGIAAYFTHEASVVTMTNALMNESKQNDALLRHKDAISTYFLENKIDLMNFDLKENDFIIQLKQHCRGDEELEQALKILYLQIQQDIKALEQEAITKQDDQDDQDMYVKPSWDDAIVSECIANIKSIKILPLSIPMEDTALSKQCDLLKKEKEYVEKHEMEVESSCKSIQQYVHDKRMDPMLSDSNPFKVEGIYAADDQALEPAAADDKPLEDVHIMQSKTMHQCRVRFEEELHAKTKSVSPTKSTLELFHKKKKKWQCKCNGMKKLSKSVTFTSQVASRAMSLVDIVSDSYLLYTVSLIPELWFLTLTLVLSISASYIISYSSGVQLYLFRHTFDSLKGFKKLLMIFFILPTGILYFVFLDLADIYLRLFRWMYFVLCCKSIQEMQQYEQVLAAQLGMDRMNWEGFKAQRSIGQLMFESIPQFIVQTIVFYGLDLDSMISNDSDIASKNTISDTQLLISIASALFNIIGTMIRLKIDSNCCKTDVISYALNCVKARVDWIPQLEHILEAIKNKTTTAIDYEMSFKMQCIPYTRRVDYDFSVTTVNRLISELRAIDVSDYYMTHAAADDAKLLQIHFRDSLRLLPLQNIIELLAICQEKGVKVLSVTSGKSKKKYDWFTAIEISKAHGKDVQLLEYSRDDQGLPYIMKLMKLTDIEERRSIFRDLIEHDFDLNSHDLVTNESIVYTLIRSYDYKNLNYLFEHYSVNKGVLLRLNYHNKDGISPLGVALNQYQHELLIRSNTEQEQQQQHKVPYLWEILFQHGAKLSFPCRTEPDISPLMLVLKELRHTSLAQSLMRNGAQLYGKETTSLNELFVHYELEEEEHWKAFVHYESEEEKYEGEQIQMDDSWIGLLCDVVKHFGHSLKSVADSNGDNPLHYFIKHSCINKIRKKGMKELQWSRMKHLLFICDEWKNERNNDGDYPFELILKQEDEYLFFTLAHFDEGFISNIMSKKDFVEQLIGWIIHMMQRITAKYPKGLRRRNRRMNADIDVKCLDKMFSDEYLGISEIKWPNKYTYTQSRDDKAYDLIDICLDKALIDVAMFLKKYWKFTLNEEQGQAFDSIRQQIAKQKLENDQTRFASIVQKRETDALFEFMDTHSNVKQNIMNNKEFVAQIIEWIIDITRNITRKYAKGITDDVRVIGDIDIQSLDRMFNRKYFGRRIKWPLSEDDHEIELIDRCLENKLYHETLYLSTYWNVPMNEEQQIKLDELKPQSIHVPAADVAIATGKDYEKEIQRIEMEEIKLNNDGNIAIETEEKEKEPAAEATQLKEKTSNVTEIKDDSDSEYDSDDSDAGPKRRMFRKIKNNTPPPVFKLEDMALEEKDAPMMAVSNPLHIDTYNEAKDFSLSLPFAHAQSSASIVAKVNTNTQRSLFKKGESHKIEILYSFLVETLSVADLITDIVVVKQLIESRQVWWISFMFLFMVSPYLVSHSTMCSLVAVRRSHYLPKQSTCPPLGLFTLNILSLVLLTPFAIIWFSLVDVIFMLYLVISSLMFAVSAGYCDISNIMDDLLFQKVLGMTKMEVIGYRRLRTLSQLLFETFPQILLQIRILIAIRYEGQDDFSITTEELYLSIGIALIHVVLEVAIIYLDSRASRMSLSHYAVACLAARLHWIPFLTQIADKSQTTENIFNFEVIQYKVWFFCNNTYRIKYEFTPSAFKKLGERVMKLPVISCITTPSNRILSSIWTEYHVANTMPIIKLGNTCCRSLNLELFPLFFRSADKRVMIETFDIDWKRILYKFQRSAHYSSTNSGEAFLNVLLTEFLNFVEIELIVQLAVQLRLDHTDIKKNILQQLSVSSDILRILKQYYDKNVYFGLNQQVTLAIYSLFDDNKWFSLYETDSSYIYVILLVLWYTRRTIYKHQNVVGSTRFGDDPQRYHFLQKVRTSVLPKYITISYKDNGDNDENGVKVPFELVECFKYFQPQIEQCLIELTARSRLKSDRNYMYITDKALFEYFATVCDTQCIDFLILIINASWNVIQEFPIHILFAQLFCRLDPIVSRLEMVHGFGHYLLSSSAYRESTSVSITLKYEHHCEILDINHCEILDDVEEEKHSVSQEIGEIEMQNMLKNEIILSNTKQSFDAIGISRIEIDFDGFQCDAPLGTVQVFTVLPINSKDTAISGTLILNKIVLAEISFETLLSWSKFSIDLHDNEVLGSVGSIYMPLKLSIKPLNDTVYVKYNQINIEIKYLSRKFKDIFSLRFENVAHKVYELQSLELAKFVNKYGNEFEDNDKIDNDNERQTPLHILCDLDDPNVEIFEMILKSKGNIMINKLRFDGKTPLKVLQDNMRMDTFIKSEMLQHLLSHNNIETIAKQKNVVIVGCKNSGKHTLLEQLKIYYKKNKFKPKQSFKVNILKFMIKSMKTMIRHCGEKNISLLNNADASKIYSINTKKIHKVEDLPMDYEALFASIQKLWNKRSIKKVYTDIGFMLHLSESVQYFFDFRLKMIQSQKYVPSDVDILMLPQHNAAKNAVQSIICTVNDGTNDLQIRWIVHSTDKILKLSPIYNNNQMRNKEDDEDKKEEKNEILPLDIDTVIFMISLTSFLEMNVCSKTNNNFLNALKMYKKYCLDAKFNKTKFVVILNKADLFQRKLKNKKNILKTLNDSVKHKSYDEWLDLIKAMFTAQCPSRTYFFYHESIASDPKSLFILKELENVVIQASTIQGLPIKHYKLFTFLQQIDLDSYFQQFVENGITEITPLGAITTQQLQNDIKMLNLGHRLKLQKHIRSAGLVSDVVD